MGITNNIFTEPLYYFEFDAAISFPEDIATNVTFTYNDGANPAAIFNDGGALTATYASLADFITALNAAQTIFVFEEVTGTQLKRTDAVTTLIAVKSGSRVIPDNFVSDLYIEWVVGANINGGLQTLYPNNTSSDQLLQKLVDMNALLTTANGLLNDVISSSLDSYALNETIPNNASSLVVRPIDYNYEVAKGFVSEATTVNKFGYNQDIDTASPEVIASFGGSVNIMTTADTLNIVSSSANDATGGTGASFIQISGIGADNLSQTELITINGTTPVTTVNTWLGVNRMFVLTSGTLETNAGDITATDTLGTVGIQAQIPASNSVTQQCIFHTQIGYSFLIDYFLFNAIKISGGGGNPEVTFKVWSYSRVTNTRYEILRQVIDTQRGNYTPINLSQPLPTGGREVIYITAETDVNNTACNARFSGIESLST